MSADHVWFNSEFHRRNLFAHIRSTLRKMPKLERQDNARWAARLEQIEESSAIHFPGIQSIGMVEKESGPLHIVWVARWEHDKIPEQFFAALRELRRNQIEFRVSVLGESYSQAPECFTVAEEEFQDSIKNWGFTDSRSNYEQILQQSDVVVSTAIHEFFGIAVVEAMSAGCVPLLPDRLSYPELVKNHSEFLYDGSTNELVVKLSKYAHWKMNERNRLVKDQTLASSFSQRFIWDDAAQQMDERLKRIVMTSSSAADDHFRTKGQ